MHFQSQSYRGPSVAVPPEEEEFKVPTITVLQAPPPVVVPLEEEEVSPAPPIVEVLFQTRLQELEATYPKASKPDLTAEDTSKQQMRECFISLSAKHVSTVVGQIVAMQPLLRRPTASQQGKPN
jgi:hypothetical protein